MLIEIQSDAFRTEAKNGPIRPTIKFKKGLNVINGSVTGTNSIGKSTFMMAIDFCFGGKGYAKLENVKNNVGIHDINFAFKFDSSATPFYFQGIQEILQSSIFVTHLMKKQMKNGHLMNLTNGLMNNTITLHFYHSGTPFHCIQE